MRHASQAFNGKAQLLAVNPQQLFLAVRLLQIALLGGVGQIPQDFYIDG
jgi:hypothetical protein